MLETGFYPLTTLVAPVAQRLPVGEWKTHSAPFALTRLGAPLARAALGLAVGDACWACSAFARGLHVGMSRRPEMAWVGRQRNVFIAGPAANSAQIGILVGKGFDAFAANKMG